jgi:hypothetical protein
MAKLAKLDDDGNIIAESAVDVVTIKVDGQEVEVPQSAVAILEKKEHDLTSRNERALREGRETTAQLLAEDTQWFNTHPTELWAQYQPKVNGGKGFTGDPTMLTEKPVETQKTAVPAADNSEVKALKEDLQRTKDTLDAVVANMGRTGEQKAIETRDKLIRQYPNADSDAVTDGMRNFFAANNRHPVESEIETIVKARHNFVTAKIESAKTPPPTTLVVPVVGGGTPPSLSQTKTPRLDDLEGWKNLAHADNVSPG